MTRPRGLAGLLVALLAAGVLWWTQGGDPTTTAVDRAPSPGASSSRTSPSSTSAPAPEEGSGVDPASGLPLVRLADLPPEATETVRLIDAGGPFPHDEDGETFHNREGLLPEREDGHYREYTVETPGSDDRGARRIVAGADGELYWTGDHYASFARIVRDSP